LDGPNSLISNLQSLTSNLQSLIFKLNPDWLIAVLLFAAGMVAYVSTLAPTVLEGDAALFEYTPWVLGVTYPTGFPSYVLLGHLWTLLVPIGSVAYRMNLLSAVCGALALACLYPTLRRFLESRLAALSAILIFGTLPTYWRWATEAKSYTLHILLLSGILWLLSRGTGVKNLEVGFKVPPSPQPYLLREVLSPSEGEGASVPSPLRGGGRVRGEPWGVARILKRGLTLSAPEPAGERARWAWAPLLAAALFGLALGNHNTTLLLAPGLFLLFWLEYRPAHHTLRTTLCYLAALIIPPALLYLYIPLRAEWLLAQEGTLPGLTVPVAVARGLVADFYQSGPAGLLRYFTAADFTHGVVSNWSLIPQQLVGVYWPLVRDDFTPWGAALALAGAIHFAAWRPRRFWPLFLIYAALIPFVLTYGQGEQSAFLLPSSLMLATFGGAAVAGGLRGIGSKKQGVRSKEQGERSRDLKSRAGLLVTNYVLPAILIAAVIWLPVQQTLTNVAWLTGKWDAANYQYWTDVLAHPMEPGAGMLAHWGDLTAFWYLQHVEGLRPDLYGLYPPTEATVAEWLAAGRALYIAGPLQDWAPGVEARYRLLPWGRLVRLAPHDADPLALLPAMPGVPGEVLFGDRIRLLKASYDTQTHSGGILPATLAWQTAGSLPADALVSLRLVADDGTIMAQFDDALVSGWLPADSLPSGQVLLSFHRFKLPAGTLPGDYRLQVALSQPHVGAWPLSGGRPALDLGRVTVTPADPSQPPDPWGEYKSPPEATFGDEIRLAGYGYSVTRAGQGKGFAARFLWQAVRPPAADYTLLAELVDGQGVVRRAWQHTPANGRAPTHTWAAGQTVADQVDLVLPADAPPGDDTLRVRLAWLQPDGTRLPVRGWLFPAGDSVTLPGVRVTEKEDRVFEPPAMQVAVGANFDDKIELLGYNMGATRLAPDDKLSLSLVWRSRTSDMSQSYTVFVHLVGPDGALHGQWDKVPGERSKQPTTGWVTGEVVVDPIEVPLAPDAPPGTYRVQVGLYLAPDGPRLPLRGGAGGDALELGQIEVEK
jgi:hypothetical protein